MLFNKINFMNKLFYITLIVSLFTGIFKSNATPRPPSPPGLEKKVPIDAGVSLLLLAGAAVGVKKLKKK